MNFANIDGLRYRVSAGPEGGGRIEARIGSPTGQLLATTPVNSTGGWFTFATTPTTPITAPAGKHDVYLVFRSNPGVNWSMTLDAFEAVGAGVGIGQPVDPTAPRIDRTTGGDWVGKYGQSGYVMPLSDSSLPAGVTVTPNAAASVVHLGGDLDAAARAAARRRQRAARRRPGSTRPPALRRRGRLPGRQPVPARHVLHQLRRQPARADRPARQTRRDASSLPRWPVTNFVEGQWVGWTINEPVTIQVRKTSGNNTVMSGVFLTEIDETAPTLDADDDPGGQRRRLARPARRVAVRARAATTGSARASRSCSTPSATGRGATYSDPLAVLADGRRRSPATARLDSAGNVSDVGELPIRIDTIAPTAVATVSDRRTIAV